MCLFFALGSAISLASGIALLVPGSPIEPMWRLKPAARRELAALGVPGILLMGAVSAACALTARGLWKRRPWGIRLALGVLAVNAVGDLLNAVIRHDARTLIGLPIAGGMMAYLLSAKVRQVFGVPAPA